jgi:hypothetical protein
VSVSGADLLESEETGGILQAGLFPDLSTGGIESLLDGYVANAAALAGNLTGDDQDAAIRAYGNWQSYERRLEQLAGHGRGQISLAGQFAVGTTGDQITELRRKADFWRLQWEAYVPSSSASGSRSGAASRTTPTASTW